MKINRTRDADPAPIQEVDLVLVRRDPDHALVLDRQGRDLHIPVQNQSPNLNPLPDLDHLVDLPADHLHVRDRNLRQSRSPNLNPVLEADLVVALILEVEAILEIAADLVLVAEERAPKKANHVLDHQSNQAKAMTEQLQTRIPKTISYRTFIIFSFCRFYS